MSPKQIDKAGKREMILRRAMQVFARQGIYDFKMIDIAHAAGVGKGTLYEYFKSKSDLIDGCTQLFMADYSREIVGRLSKMKNPKKQVYEIIQGTLSYFMREPERLQLIFDFWAFTYRHQDRMEEILKLTEFFAPLRLHFTNIIQLGIDQGYFKKTDPQTTALTLMALVDGLLFYLAMGLIDINDKGLVENTGRTFLEGILA